MLSPYWVPVFDRLSQKGWDIRVFVANELEPGREYDRASMTPTSFEVKKTANCVLRIPGLKGRTGFVHLQYGLWRELKAWQPDVILSSELGFRTIISLLFGLRAGVPMIPWVCASSHTERNNSFLREYFRKRILAKAPCVCTNHTEATEYLRKGLGVATNKIFQTPYTIDVAGFNTKILSVRGRATELKGQLGLRTKVYLYVGQIIPRKGLSELARGIVAVDRELLQDVSFLFVGGQLPDDVRNSLTVRGIHFAEVPFVQPRDLPQYYAMSDVFVFPSLEDEWGIVLNEAAAAGLPIIASKFAAATADLVEDNVNGFVIDPYDPVQVTAAIGKVAAMSPESLGRLGNASYRRALDIGIDFTLLNMYRALLFAQDTFGQQATLQP
jgi:glycosyltransferase involved in cell wall biosynthesis